MRWMMAAMWAIGACTPATEPDVDLTPPAPGLCEVEGWTARPLITEGSFGVRRRDLAGDFTISTTAGEWSFFERFTGCESYVFVPDALVVSPLDDTPLLSVRADLEQLIETSPLNVHYFFLALSDDRAEVADFAADMQERVDKVLQRLESEEAAWWAERLHVVDDRTSKLGWVEEALTSTGVGFAIDRFQRIRGFGGLADVTRFDPALDAAGAWPWQANLAYVAHEALYYEYESDREDTLALDEWTPVYLFHQENNAANGRSYVTAELPDAATMAGFDTLLVDLTHDCDPSMQELGNCDAWDAIEELWLCDEDDPEVCDTEIARYITTYHREGRWLVDVSHLLPLLSSGGERRFRYAGFRGGHFNTLRLLFTNRDKGAVPIEATHLWSGGNHDANYAANHPPVQVQIPADATRVYLYMVLSGHGQGGDDNCAEFCDHQHTFTFAGGSVLASHPNMGDQLGCLKQIGLGTVPNQNGTWWFERSSWCPGKQVDPWVWDVTDLVTPGAMETIAYTTNYSAAVDDGWIDMQSWLVAWR